MAENLSLCLKKKSHLQETRVLQASRFRDPVSMDETEMAAEDVVIPDNTK